MSFSTDLHFVKFCVILQVTVSLFFIIYVLLIYVNTYQYLCYIIL